MSNVVKAKEDNSLVNAILFGENLFDRDRLWSE